MVSDLTSWPNVLNGVVGYPSSQPLKIKEIFLPKQSVYLQADYNFHPS
jgi:hypothetical protein